MDKFRRALLGTLVLLSVIGGIPALGQKKDDRTPPPKKGDVVVPVTPKRDPPRGNGNQNSNHDKKRP